MGSDANPRLSPETVLRHGGWHLDFARVLLIEQYGDRALVLIDGNGDGAELEVEYWCHAADWTEQASSGFGSVDEVPVFESWQPDGFVCAIGRTRPGDVVLVEYAGQTYRRTANHFGLWGFAHEAGSYPAAELPKLMNGS